MIPLSSATHLRYWEWRAEYLARKLGTYTPISPIPSFTGALVSLPRFASPRPALASQLVFHFVYSSFWTDFRLSQDCLINPAKLNTKQASRTIWSKIGWLFSGPASCLDAFSTYQLARSCSAMPCQTTDTPEAPAKCSSRTDFPLPSVIPHTW